MTAVIVLIAVIVSSLIAPIVLVASNLPNCYRLASPARRPFLDVEAICGTTLDLSRLTKRGEERKEKREERSGVRRDKREERKGKRAERR